MNGAAHTNPLTPAAYLEISKSTLFHTLLRCEAPLESTGRAYGTKGQKGQVCGHLLSCWKAYYKHLLSKHVSKHSQKNSTSKTFRCRGPRCNTTHAYHTYKDLKRHVEQVHMKNVPLTCPLSTCAGHGRIGGRNQTFLKDRDLMGHLNSEHAAQVGRAIEGMSFLPNHEPARPRAGMAPPPPLPTGEFAWYEMTSLAQVTMRKNTKWLDDWKEAHEGMQVDQSESSMRRTESPSPPPTASPRKTQRMQRTSTNASMTEPQEEETTRQWEFDDLPGCDFDDPTDVWFPPMEQLLREPYFTLQRPVRAKETFGPGTPQAKPAPIPPPTIFFEALRLQVDSKSGEG